MVATITADLFVSADGYARGDGVGPYFNYGGPELDHWIASELARPLLTYTLPAGGPG